MGIECYGRQIHEFELQKMLREPKAFYQWLLGIEQRQDLTAEVAAFTQAIADGTASQFREEQKRKLIPYIYKEWMKMVGKTQGEETVMNMLESQFPDAKKYLARSAQELADEKTELDETLNLHKDWHILHFLLSGSVEATDELLGQCILGGREVLDELGVMSYGPARYFTEQDVKAIADELADLTEDDLETLWNPSLMDNAGVYGVDSNDEFDADRVMQYFELLRDFYADAAQKNNAVVMYLT
jgi:hypothetical protein